MFQRPRFDRSRNTRREQLPFWKRWKSAWTAALCVLGLAINKPVLANQNLQEPGSTSPSTQEILGTPSLTPAQKLQFLKQPPTAKERQSLERLRARLQNIANKNVLSTPEQTKLFSQNPENINQGIYSGVQTVNTNTEAYFLEKPDNTYTDILTQNSTTELQLGTQSSTTQVTTTVPVEEGVLTSESFVFLENEAGEYESRLPQRRGYINADGSIDSTVSQSSGGVNLAENSSYARGAVVSSGVIEQIRRPGRVDRDFINRYGYVVQGRAFQNLGTPTTELTKQSERSLAATVTNTAKHTHSTSTATTVRTSLRAYGYQTNAPKEANLLLNLAAAAAPKPLSSTLEEAKIQAQQRAQTGQAPVKKAVVHSPEVLETLHATKTDLERDLQPRFQESVLRVQKDKPKGSYFGVDFGTQEVVRQKTETLFNQTKPSAYQTRLREGIETTLNSEVELQLNGQTPSKDTVAGIYMGLDTRNYVLQTTQQNTTYRQAELSAGVSGGLVRGKHAVAGRVGANYDELDGRVYPTLALQTTHGQNTKLTTQTDYSTHPSISKPNQTQISMSTDVSFSPNAGVRLSAKQTLDLGQNRPGYKTRTSLQAGFNVNRKVRLTAEAYLGDGEKTDRGYLLGAVLRQNWGLIYANYKKLNQTTQYQTGIAVRTGQKSTLEVEYRQSRGEQTDLFDSETIQLKFGRRW